MSWFPHLLEFDRFKRIGNANVAITATPEELLSVICRHYPVDYDNFRNWKLQMTKALRDPGATVRSDKNKYQINLDVQHFTPEDISVKTVDGFIVIEAKHEEKKDNHGWVSRQINRRYQLPERYNIDSVQCRLSSDGVLMVTAPAKNPTGPNERVIHIMQTGPVKNRSEGTKMENSDGEATVSVSAENGQ